MAAIKQNFFINTPGNLFSNLLPNENIDKIVKFKQKTTEKSCFFATVFEKKIESKSNNHCGKGFYSANIQKADKIVLKISETTRRKYELKKNFFFFHMDHMKTQNEAFKDKYT